MPLIASAKSSKNIINYIVEGVDKVLPKFLKVLIHFVPQFTVHIAGVHQDWDDPQVQAGDHGVAAGALALLRQPAHQPVASQHPDDVPHTHHPRGE